MAAIEQSAQTADASDGRLLPRDEMIELLRGLPADSSYEDVVRALAMARMFDRGQADLTAGRTMTHEEVGKQIAQWQN